ncbi:hypothetical protein SE19_02540 [Acidiplasma aeolicum]|uniref:Uncharacterized protein n=2 Tax=Acidiplasma TaxID=507753 RepID=A0A0Q0RXV9_9ARCH|nr:MULTISPECIES: hypothetical protein [Acidiplasma]KPV47086.1 hypothetical protein SE19_02540 [Acidiplasma aeolicum]KQB34197.1 hypothetical protein AOG54_05575 [Acidiplasma aeolicum]KQB34878.1 hypothetical protein AOG55_08805 [Acidiplasma cupricumulans]
MIKAIKIDDKQKILDDYNYRPAKKLYEKRIFREYKFLEDLYKEKYHTDNFDVYDLYDLTFNIKTRFAIKNSPRNAFIANYKKYLKMKDKLTY